MIAWLHQTNFGAFDKAFRDNDIDGPTLLKLSDSMVVRLLPTIRLEVQFLDLLQTLKQRHTAELNGESTLASSSSSTVISTNGHHHHDRIPSSIMASSSLIENGIEHSSNSNSPIARPRSTPKVVPALKSVKREAKYLPNPMLK